MHAASSPKTIPPNIPHNFHMLLRRGLTTTSTGGPQTLFDKIWSSHVVDGGSAHALIYVDRHLVHEVTSPQAFEGLRLANRRVRRTDCTIAVPDHNVTTSRERLTGGKIGKWAELCEQRSGANDGYGGYDLVVRDNE